MHVATGILGELRGTRGRAEPEGLLTVSLLRGGNRLAESHPADGIGDQAALLVLVRVLDSEVRLDELDDLAIYPGRDTLERVPVDRQ